MFRAYRTFFMTVLLMLSVFNGCKDTSLSTTPQTQSSNEGIIAETPVYSTESFESGSKGSYAAADVTLSTGVWNLNDVLIGTTVNDVKNGNASARARNSGKLTQQSDRTTGIGTVTIQHAKYGTDAGSTWGLWYSTNSGAAWQQTGSSVNTTTTTFQTASFTLNIAGTVRLEIRKTDGTASRINFDDIVFSDFIPDNPAPSVSSMYPAYINNGVAQFTLSVYGNNFVSTSVVNWNGTPLTTVYTSSVQLDATVPAALVAATGTASITVTTPAPGGGTTSGLTFTIIPASSNVHLTMGNPSAAQKNTALPLNYLIERGQYALSYNRDRGIANWVAWQLNSYWTTGNAVDNDQFKTDATLPTGWYRVKTGDYTNSGFSRGHLCASADRKSTQTDMDTAYLMTNIFPQTQANNGGPWAVLETYCRTLANQGNILYIYAGGQGTGGTGLNGYKTTLANGVLTVPSKTWKVIMVLPAGTNDLSRVSTTTRCIAVVLNNDLGPFNSWGTYRVSVDSIEALTGYDFFSNVTPAIQAVIEANADSGPTQ